MAKNDVKRRRNQQVDCLMSKSERERKKEMQMPNKIVIKKTQILLKNEQKNFTESFVLKRVYLEKKITITKTK